jgi:hypothetical protein
MILTTQELEELKQEMELAGTRTTYVNLPAATVLALLGYVEDQADEIRDLEKEVDLLTEELTDDES